MKNETVDPFVVSSLVCVFGCIFNPIFILFQEANGNYKPVDYNLGLQVILAVIVVSYTISCIAVNRLYYIMKASWGRVALNMQIVVTFTFDVFIAGIKFNRVEILGCCILIFANVYLVIQQLYFQEKKH